VTTAGAPAVAVVRAAPRLRPDPSRVIARLFVPGAELVAGRPLRAAGVAGRILALDDDQVERTMADVMARFGHRHPDLPATFARHAERIAELVDAPVGRSDARSQLLGATFTQEAAIEAAALCNPSLVAHPDQAGAEAGGLRFVMSVRGIGEGHRSSVGFRTGHVTADGLVSLDEPGPFSVVGTVDPVDPVAADGPDGPDTTERGYTTAFPATTDLSERVLWPATATESHGIEDARFVRFTDDDGSVTYLATYTAYDGVGITQHLMESPDLTSFTSSPLVGPAAANKGLALFPRRVDGRFAALSRYDEETNAVAFSDDPRRWDEAVSYQLPRQPWETIQLGNCGAPIETDEGWLVLTHGVGPVRTYCIGAVLLDLDDPTRMVGRLAAPLLSPAADEQDGYVPNVVYSCGALLHAGTLVIPYGIADASIGIATVRLTDLLAALRHDGA